MHLKQFLKLARTASWQRKNLNNYNIHKILFEQKQYNNFVQEFTHKNCQMDERQNQQYEQVDFPQYSSFPQQPFLMAPPSPILLSKKQQQQLLFSIKFNMTQNQNLLDITCEETNPRTSRNFDYRDWRAFADNRIIEIFGPITIQEGYITSYKLYKIKTRKKDKEGDDWETVVERRYSDFQYLHQRFIQNYGGYLIPRLPEKNMWVSLNMQSYDDIKIRKQKLKKYIQKVLLHNRLRYTEEFLIFLFDPQNNFSQKKGQYTSQYNLQDTVIKVTTNALDSGLSVISKYMIKSGIMEQGNQNNDYGLLKQKNKKQNQELMHYEIIVNGLTSIIRDIKIIVENTYKQKTCIGGFDELCEIFLEESQVQQGKNRKDKNRKKSKIEKQQKSKSQQFPQLMSSLKYEKYQNLLESYENLFQFIESCKQAIGRRNQLSRQLITFKQQQQVLMQKYKNNPRNIDLDILRSKIVNTNKKYQKFTQDLLQQLETQVIMSKSMVGQFVQELTALRSELYQQQGL